jgi:hypothetical protein
MNNTDVHIEDIKNEFNELIEHLKSEIAENRMKFVNNTLKEFLLSTLETDVIHSLHDIYQDTLNEFPEKKILYKAQCESMVLSSLNGLIVPIKGIISETAPWLSDDVNVQLDTFMKELIKKIQKGGGPYNTLVRRFTRRIPYALSALPGRTLNLPRLNPVTYKNRPVNQRVNIINVPLRNLRNMNLPKQENIVKYTGYIEVLGKEFIFGRLREVTIEYGKKLNEILESAIKPNLKKVINKYKWATDSIATFVVNKYYSSFCDAIIRKLVVNIIHATFTNIEANHEWITPVADILEYHLVTPLLKPTVLTNSLK